jgi:uncharacterized protein
MPFRKLVPCWLALPMLGALAPTALPAQASQEAGFVIRLNADTFAVESFTRTADRREGGVAGAAVGRVAYTVALGPASTTPELRLRAWRTGMDAAAEPAQVARLALRGDSATAEITTPAGTRVDRLATRPAAILYLSPSFAQVEQLVRRARAIGGDRVEVPVLMVQGGQTLVATVTAAGADSVVIGMAGSEIRAAVTADGRLTGGSIPAQGLTFQRVGHAVPTEIAVRPPDYSAPEGAPFTAEEVTVEARGGHRLVGTLTRPRGGGRLPAVVMITGSGAQDRDQALPILPGYRPFRDIADTLSRRGIAVLRLDDRGTGASTGEFASATSADFADDVRDALAYLRGRPDIDARRLGLVGHSEGGLIAPMIAATDTTLRAIVLIAGPAQTGREIIEFQQRQAVETNPAIPAESRDSVLAGMQAQLLAGAAEQPWLRFFLDHDPLPTARRVRHASVLVLHGETDRQVTPDQAATLAEAFRSAGNADVELRIFPDVNHLLLRDADGSPGGYMRLTGREVVPEVRGAAADWLAARMR